MRVEFYVDHNVQNDGSDYRRNQDKPIQPKEKVKRDFTEANFEAAKKVKCDD
jgi:hypothetical protein